MNDWLAVLISFIYVFAVLGAAEALRKALKLPVEFTRKVVHIGVGMWAFGTAALFSDKWFAIIPPAAFILLNTISYRRGTFAAMETGDKRNLGTVYFPIAFVAIILLFFDVSKPFMVAALMPLTWGDAFAAIIGQRFGRRRYALFDADSQRSLEGSAAMFVFSFVSVALTFIVFGAPPDVVAAFAMVMALFATIAEAISPAGLDNLVIPASSALVYLLFIMLLQVSPVG